MSRKTRLLLCFAIICFTAIGASVFAPTARAQGTPPDILPTITVGTLTVGQPGAYTVTVTEQNQGPTTGPINITGTLPTGITLGSGSGVSWSCSGTTTVSCDFNPTLSQGGATSVLTLNVNVSPAAFAASPVSFSITAATAGETNTANNTATAGPTTVNGAPNVGVNISTSGTLVVGQTVNFNITVNNIGGLAAAAANTINISDTFPGSLALGAPSGANWTCTVTAPTVNCTYTAALGIAAVSTTLVIPTTPNSAGSIADTVTATATGDFDLSNNSATTTINVADAPDVAATSLVAAGAFVVGIQNSFTLHVQNSGSGTTTGNIVATITLQGANFTGLPASSGGNGFTCSGAPVMTCTRSTPMAGGTGADLTIAVNPILGGTGIVTTASVTTTNDLTTGNNNAQSTNNIGFVDIAVTKTNPASLTIGVPAIYTVQLSNPAAANKVPNVTTILVTENVPTGMTFNSATSTDAAWTCPNGTVVGPGTVVCTYAGAINPGQQSGLLNLSLTPTANGTFTNNVTISTPSDQNAANDTSTTAGLTVQTPGLTIGVVVAPSTPPDTVGKNFDYNVTVTNTGAAGSPATLNFTVGDKLTYVAFSGPGVIPQANWTCTAPTVGPGGTVTCNYPGIIAGGGGTAPVLKLTVQPIALGVQTTASTMTIAAPVGDTATPKTFTDIIRTFAAAPTPTPVPIIDLTVGVTHTSAPPPNFQVSTAGTVNVTVTNIGATPSTGTVTVVVVLQGNLTATPGTYGGFVCTGTITISCTSAASIVNGTPATFSVPVTAPATAANGPFTNSATVSGGADANAANNNGTDPISFAIVAAPAADLDITSGANGLTHTGNFVSGTGNTYTLTIQNSGAAVAAIGWQFKITSPAVNLAFPGTVGGGFAAFTCVNSGPQILTCTSPATLGIGATITGTINVTPTGAATVNTVAQVIAAADTNPSNDFSTNPTVITAGLAPDLNITKTAPGTFTVNQNASYNFTVNNIGSGPTTGAITVTDTLNTVFTFISGSGATCGAAGQVVTCTVPGPIAAGGSASFSVVVRPNGTNGGLPVTNQATVATPGDANAANDTSNTTSTTIGGLPNLTVSKSHAGNFLVSNGSGTYTITVNNIGNGATTGTITVTDTLPSALLSFGAPNGAATGGWACAGTPIVTCTNTTVIGPGSSTSFQLTVNVNTPGTGANGIAVTGGGMATTFTGTPDPTTVDAAPQPAFTVTKTGPPAFIVGQNGTYTITVRNSGSGPTTGNINVADNLPGGQTLVSGTGGGFTCTGTGTSTVSCDSAGPIAAGSSAIITLTVTNPAVNPGVVNTATASGGGVTASASGSTPAIPINGVADLTITKAASGTFVANQQGTFVITVTNSGSAATTGSLTVTDTLPGGMTFVSAAGGGWTCGAVGQIVTCSNPSSLAGSGGASAFNLTVNVTGSGLLTNNVSVGAAPGETNLANNTASVSVTVAPPNPAAVSPSLSTAVANPTTTAVNTGSSTITVTIRTNGGTIPPANTVTVTLTGNPNAGVTVTPSTTMLADATGTAVFTVKSTVAQTTVFTITAQDGFGLVTLTQQPSVTFSATAATGIVDTTKSTIISDCLTIPGDNITPANITVTLKDGNSNPVVSKGVTLVGTPANASVLIAPVSATTDASGLAKFTVRTSLTSGSITLTANTSDIPPVIISGATVNFGAVGTKCVPNPAATAAATAAAANNGVPLLTVPSDGPLTGIVVATRLNVRVGPGINFDRIGQLILRTKVVLVCKNPRGTWFQIQLFNGTAWISARWVRVLRTVFRLVPICGQGSAGTAILAPDQNGEATGIVNTYLLRVRTGPGSDFPQIGLLQLGDEVVLLGKNVEGTWFKVRLQDGSTGWVSAFFIKVKRIPNKVLPVVE